MGSSELGATAEGPGFAEDEAGAWSDLSGETAETTSTCRVRSS